jgi:4,5-DOPA dioxygenase extradiol
MNTQTISQMPVLFVGHGNPMNSINDNKYTRGWAELGKVLPKPSAILAISAHWYIPEVSVTVMHPPRTIHDFYGFPKQLFEIQYPSPGSPELAEQVADLLKPDTVSLSSDWGLDHGTWSVLRHIYPEADVPVIQLSLDTEKTPEEHYRLGQCLKELRKDGVLIVGSGNIVHNLAGFDWRNSASTPPDWAIDFEEWNRSQLLSGESDALIDYLQTGKMASLSAPSPDHYLPLLYLAGLQEKNDEVSFPVEGFDGGTMSMLSVLLTSQEPVD